MCRFEDYPDETETILFDGMASKGPSGRASDGIIVFVDRRSGIDVKQGEMWICKLHRNASVVSTNYFAWPIDRVGTDEFAKETLVVADNGTVTIAGDSVYSDSLPDGMYAVYRSLNGRRLELKKGIDGDIPCKDGTMRLEGLKAILAGGSTEISLLTMDEGHFIIKLEQRNDLRSIRTTKGSAQAMEGSERMKNGKMKPTGLRIEIKKDRKTKDLKGVNMVLTDGDSDFIVKMDMELLAILRDVADGILHQKELDDISDGYRIAGE